MKSARVRTHTHNGALSCRVLVVARLYFLNPPDIDRAYLSVARQLHVRVALSAVRGSNDYLPAAIGLRASSKG